MPKDCYRSKKKIYAESRIVLDEARRKGEWDNERVGSLLGIVQQKIVTLPRANFEMRTRMLTVPVLGLWIGKMIFNAGGIDVIELLRGGLSTRFPKRFSVRCACRPS